VGRIKALDGLRAVAVGLVIWAHLSSHFSGRGDALGMLGVRIFFVLSGFLITSLMVGERKRSGRISISSFYLRRAFRILPAFYTFLIAVAVANICHIIYIPNQSFISSLLYIRNYAAWDVYTGHLWSLSVEEQFYIVWPVVMSLTRTRGACLCAGLMLPVSFAVRTFSSFTLPGALGFFANADSLACGCLVALLWSHLANVALWQRIISSGWFRVTPLIILGLVKLQSIGHFRAAATLLINVLIAALIERIVRYPMGPITRILSSRPFTVIGTLSYSLYLWQQPFAGGSALPIQQAPWNLLAIVTCATASYRLVEAPMLRVGANFRERLDLRRAAKPSFGLSIARHS